MRETTRTVVAGSPGGRRSLGLGWMIVAATGGALLIAALVLGIVNARSAARFFGGGGSQADLRSFITFDAWIPALAMLGLGAVLAGVALAVKAAVSAVRRTGDDLQGQFGHSLLAPQPALAVRVLGWLTIAGLAVLTAALVLAIVRASYLSDFYSLTVEEQVSASGSKLARFGTAQAWAAWLGPLQWAGIGLVVAAIGSGVVAVVEELRYQGWRLRDMASDHPHQAPGEIYVLTRSE